MDGLDIHIKTTG